MVCVCGVSDTLNVLGFMNHRPGNILFKRLEVRSGYENRSKMLSLN